MTELNSDSAVQWQNESHRKVKASLPWWVENWRKFRELKIPTGIFPARKKRNPTSRPFKFCAPRHWAFLFFFFSS